MAHDDSKTMNVRYLGHSAWLVESQARTWLFDYGRVPVRGSADEGTFALAWYTRRPLDILFSHLHGDHCHPELAHEAAAQDGVAVYLGLDAPPGDRLPAWTRNARLVLPRSRQAVPGQTLLASGSTDQGVSWLVATPDVLLYHGGDLALWDDLDSFRQPYKQEVGWLAEQTRALGRVPDIAFLPVSTSDGYQEDALLEGIDFFLQTIRPRIVFPMHAWGFEPLYERFAGWMAVHHPETAVCLPGPAGHSQAVKI